MIRRIRKEIMLRIHKEMNIMKDEEREKLVRELLKNAYKLYQTSCKIQEIKPLNLGDWALSVGLEVEYSR